MALAPSSAHPAPPSPAPALAPTPAPAPALSLTPIIATILDLPPASFPQAVTNNASLPCTLPIPPPYAGQELKRRAGEAFVQSLA